MAMNINSDLIRGNINTIILKALYDGDRYGYDIIREIEEKSHGQYVLKQATLYSCLKRLENQGFITSYWGEQSNGGRRRYYSLTDMGREVFIKNQDEYEFSRTIIDQLISDRNYNLDSVERPESEPEEEFREVDAEDEIDVELPRRTISDSEEVPTEEILEPTRETFDEVAPITNADSSIPHNSQHDEQRPSTLDEMLNESASTYSERATTEEIVFPQTGFSAFSAAIQESPEPIFGENTTYSLDEYLAVETMVDEKEETPATTPTEQDADVATSTTEFLRYDTPISTEHEQQQTTTTINDTYRSTLNALFERNQPQPTEPEPQTESPAQDKPKQQNRDELITQGSLEVKENIQVRSFGRLSESLREMGEDVKIRTHNSDAVRQYNNEYYYYSNKLRLFHYGILFLIMIFESFLTYVIIKNFVGIHTEYDLQVYVISILFCLAFPIIAAISFFVNPHKKKRMDFSLKSSIFFRIIIMLQIILITYAFNVYMGMPLGGSSEHLIFLSIPMVLSTNIPASAIIFNKLYKSKKFALA